MTSGPIEELRVPFDPSEPQAKVLRWRRLLRGRIITLVLTCVILAGLYLWRGEEMAGTGTVVIYSVILGVSLAWLLVYLAIYLRARKQARSVGTGTALCIDRRGVEVAGTAVPWAQVVAIAATKARWGNGSDIEVRRTDGEPLRVPLDHINVRPATLDLTARAYSAGRHGVDLQALDT